MEALMVAANVFQAIGAVQQGQRAADASRYNAALARQNADASRAQAAANAAKQQREAVKKIGQMRAGYGASGVTIEGSAMDVMAESAATAELDRLNILYGGAIKAHGLEGQALLDERRAENAIEESYYKAGTSLLMAGAHGYRGMVNDTQAPAPVDNRDRKFERMG
jgi:hypothetical protein